MNKAGMKTTLEAIRDKADNGVYTGGGKELCHEIRDLAELALVILRA